jgi:hypothetical protein
MQIIPAAISYQRVNKTTADVFTGAAVNLFTVAGGRVLVSVLWGRVTTVLGAGSTGKFSADPTTGTTTDLCAAGSSATDEEGTLYSLSGLVATGMLKGSSGGVQGLTTPLIIDIGSITFTGANTTGSASFQCWWMPLDDGATLVSA